MTVDELIKKLEEIKEKFGGDLFCYDSENDEINKVYIANEDNCILKNRFK